MKSLLTIHCTSTPNARDNASEWQQWFHTDILEEALEESSTD